MLDRTQTKFSHVKPGDTEFVSGGLRDFFLYRDLGVAEATHGKVIAHLVKANMAPEAGTGWHRHEADFQIVIMLKGWAVHVRGQGDAGGSRRRACTSAPASATTCSTIRPTWNTWRSCRPRISSRSTWSRCAPFRNRRPGDLSPRT
jgi:hypothetical protein